MPHKPARVFLIRKSAALAVGALLAAAAIFGAVNVPAAITAATTARQLPIYCVDRPSADGKKFCAISFDAAWGEGRLRNTVNGQNGLTKQPDAHAKLMNDGTFNKNGNWSEDGTPNKWTPINGSAVCKLQTAEPFLIHPA